MTVTQVVVFAIAMAWTIAGYYIGRAESRQFPSPDKNLTWHIAWSWVWPALLATERWRR